VVSNKFQKTRFWKEKSVEDVLTLGPTTQAAIVIIINIWELWKNEVRDANMIRCFKNERSEVVFMNIGGGKHSIT
jgi:hypothetical protein